MDLAGLGLGDAGALHLSTASLPSLTALDLALNGITSAGATSLASAMARPMATVRYHGGNGYIIVLSRLGSTAIQLTVSWCHVTNLGHGSAHGHGKILWWW